MIPKIIHQVWEGASEPLPECNKKLANTWKVYFPEWQYEFWDKKRMETFVNDFFPEMKDIYFEYRYDVQRWDVIRYLILYKVGGLYVDFDYECLQTFDGFIKDEQKCYFAMEPEEHCRSFSKKIYFNNALMITPPNHVFFKKIIEHLYSASISYSSIKFQDVLRSTGPLMLTHLYEKFDGKEMIELLPFELVSPWSQNEVRMYVNHMADEDYLDKKLEKAIAIHYFGGSW